MEQIAFLIKNISISAIPILLAIILHEIAHGYIAYKLGDPTAKLSNRLTLNPIPHIDLFGTILLPLVLLITKAGILFGWAKPVPVNPHNLNNPKKDMIWVAAAGPLTNFLLAFCSALLLKIFIMIDPRLFSISTSFFNKFNLSDSLLHPIGLMCLVSIQINIILGLFNLIPIPPADGGRILIGILPTKHANAYSKIEPFGMVLLLFVIIIENKIGILSRMFSFLTHLFIWI